MSTEEDKSLETIDKQKVVPPSMFAVVLHNDDYTTVDFVIEVLMRFFKKSLDESNKITLDVHNQGAAKVGIYTYDVAQSKVYSVLDYAERCGQPLECSMDKE